MTLADKIEGSRKLNSAYRYLCLQWALNHPEDPCSYAQWFEETAEGQAAAFLAWLCAGDDDAETIYLFQHRAVFRAPDWLEAA